MLAQPRGQCVRLAARQQRHRPVLVEVNQHGAVAVPLAQSPVIHAEGGRRCDIGHWRSPNQAQQRVAAGVQPELAAKAHAGSTSECQTHSRKPPGEARRLARPRCCDGGQAFGEKTALAPGVVAKQTSNAQPDRDGILAPGQIGERPFVAAMDAFGSPAAKRASRRSLARVKVDGDGGLGGLKRPGFEPDVGRIRQQARQ